MRRFFVEPERVSGEKAVVTGTEAHHLKAVLRLSSGEHISLFDGRGRIYQAEIEEIGKGWVETRILAVQDEPSCRQTALHLGQALLQGKKMDLIVQKATELGVAGLHPFVSSYSDGIHLDAGREERRLQRWMKIAREACKQCNRPQPPAIFPVAAFDVLLAEVKSVDFDLKLIFWEEERKQGLQEIVEQKAFRSAIILVGPEGGFSAEEVHRALAVGFQAVTLGSRILRAETAAIACTAILQYLLGNLHA